MHRNVVSSITAIYLNWYRCKRKLTWSLQMHHTQMQPSDRRKFHFFLSRTFTIPQSNSHNNNHTWNARSQPLTVLHTDIFFFATRLNRDLPARYAHMPHTHTFTFIPFDSSWQNWLRHAVRNKSTCNPVEQFLVY